MKDIRNSPPPEQQTEHGFSMIEVVIAIGVVGLILLATLKSIVLQKGIVVMAETKGVYQDVRAYVAANLNCTQTVGTQLARCAAGDYVDVLDAAGTIFLQRYPSTQTIFTTAKQSYKVRVRCINTGPFTTYFSFTYASYVALAMEVLRVDLSNPNLGKKDPLKGRLGSGGTRMDWEKPSQSAIICPFKGPQNIVAPPTETQAF